MADRLKVELFCEDAGHELFCRPLISRLAREEEKVVTLLVGCGRGGGGRALAEFKGWQRIISKRGHPAPDLLVLVIDANCHGWNVVRGELARAVDPAVFPRHVVGCPDPHVERWCLADPQGFRQVVGGQPESDPGKCEKDLYKSLLRRSIEKAGQIILSDVMEYAPDLVAKMDLYKAGRKQPSLKHFIDDLRSALRSP